MALKVLVMMLVATAEGTFQLCANPADFQATKATKYICSVTQTKCTGIGFEWAANDNKCEVEKKFPGQDPAADCTAKGGTATASITCQQAIPFIMAGYGAATKAMCKQAHTKYAPSTVQLVSYIYAGTFGCCGGTASNPKDVCTSLNPPMSMCAAGSTLQADRLMEVTCLGITRGNCGSTDSSDKTKTGFTWEDGEDGHCSVKHHLLTAAEQSANVDIVKKCTDAGGTAESVNWCGQNFQMLGAPNADKTPSKATCDAGWAPPGGDIRPLKQYLWVLASLFGCCSGSSTSSPKDVCTPFNPPTFRLCKDHSKYLPSRAYQVKCYGLTAATCTGVGFTLDAAEKVCNVIATSSSQDVHALCTSKGGTPVTTLACNQALSHMFPNLKATKAVCAATSPAVTGMTNAQTSTLGSATYGCCGTGADSTDCCSDPNCDGTIPLPPSQTSPCAPRVASAIVFVLGFFTTLLM